jgi:DNA-binding XRE family transcriptional regulator
LWGVEVNNLREVRESAGLRMMELTARCGVSASTLSAIENYDYKPRHNTKRRIADALGVEQDAIWPSQETQVVTKHATATGA